MKKESKPAASLTIEFETKIDQAVKIITDIAGAFRKTRIIAITDSWFGNNGLWKPLHKKLAQWFYMISRLRSNNNIFDLPGSVHPEIRIFIQNQSLRKKQPPAYV